jgi:hypothetical protein
MTETFSILWCSTDETACLSETGPVACEECGKEMQVIGWEAHLSI